MNVNVGEFQGFAPTGRSVALLAVAFYNFDQTGKLISERIVMNLGAARRTPHFLRSACALGESAGQALCAPLVAGKSYSFKVDVSGCLATTQENIMQHNLDALSASWIVKERSWIELLLFGCL
jgi:hypothetical protein